MYLSTSSTRSSLLTSDSSSMYLSGLELMCEGISSGVLDSSSWIDSGVLLPYRIFSSPTCLALVRCLLYRYCELESSQTWHNHVLPVKEINRQVVQRKVCTSKYAMVCYWPIIFSPYTPYGSMELVHLNCITTLMIMDKHVSTRPDPSLNRLKS